MRTLNEEADLVLETVVEDRLLGAISAELAMEEEHVGKGMAAS